MKKVAWLTDIHLNFTTPGTFADLVRTIRQTGADAVMIGGDIGEADTFADYLRQVFDQVQLPVYFVLGNHDYYRGSIEEVRATARDLHRDGRELYWLPDAGVAPLSDTTALVGHGGWGDGRIGDFIESKVILNDYLLIEELRACTIDGHRSPGNILTQQLFEKVQSLGDEAAEVLRIALATALREFRQIIVLTHVPPFLEASWYQGQLCDMTWAPHFTCHAVGKVLDSLMGIWNERRMTVLCGHTHGGGEASNRDNLHVITGPAQYSYPTVQRVLEID